MIELRIGGANEAPGIIASGWPTRAVTLLGKKDAHRVPCQGRHHLVLYFDDLEAHGDPRGVVPSPWHLQRVLAHTEHMRFGERLFINCKAGKSRSTAFAIAVMIQHGETPQEAFDHVLRVRDVMIPNRLLIGYVDDHFGLNGELNRIVADYYDRLQLPGVKLPDRGGWNL